MTITPAINDASVHEPGGESRADVLKQIAVFRFCEQVLQDRSTCGSRAWVWQVKGKVAAYCRQALENRIGADQIASDPPVYPYAEDLTDFERRQLLRSHPLLSDELPGAGEQRVSPNWLVALRSRVAWYVSRLRESHCAEHEN